MILFIYLIALFVPFILSLYLTNKFKHIIYKKNKRFLSILISTSLYLSIIISIVLSFIYLTNRNFNIWFWILILTLTGIYVGISMIYGTLRIETLNKKYQQQSKYFK